MPLDIRVNTKGLDDLIREEPKRVDAWLRGVAIQMVGDIKTSFNSGPAGRTYKRGTRYHIASRPYNAPNTDTGALIGSIRHEAAGDLAYRIVAGGVAAEYLEYGTAKMQPRPYMRPVFNAWRDKIEADAAKELDLE